MKHIRTHALPAALFAALLLVAGCANKQEPATKALADAEAALATFRAEASEYAADELQTADAAIADLKARLEKREYDAVVEGAPGLSTQIESLRQTTADRRADRERAEEAARATWATMSTDVPKMVQAIQSRVDVLSKSRQLPRNLDKARFESARADFEQVKATWSEATAAASAGNAVEAVNRGEDARSRATEVMRTLNMKVGAAS